MGGYSQIKAELILLETAVNNEKYSYYHLITGVDFPLMSQNEILKMYDSFNENFISVIKGEINQKMIDRIKYYYPFQEAFLSRDGFLSKALRYVSKLVQKLLRVNRLKSLDCSIAAGCAYFDIRDDFARYVVSKKDWIYKHFHSSFCADELFMQILYVNSNFCNKEKLNSPSRSHEYITTNSLDVNRAIDWKRGTPYIWQAEDYDMLINSGCMFARKFDYETSPDIVDKLYKNIL